MQARWLPTATALVSSVVHECCACSGSGPQPACTHVQPTAGAENLQVTEDVCSTQNSDAANAAAMQALGEVRTPLAAVSPLHHSQAHIRS